MEESFINIFNITEEHTQAQIEEIMLGIDCGSRGWSTYNRIEGECVGDKAKKVYDYLKLKS